MRLFAIEERTSTRQGAAMNRKRLLGVAVGLVAALLAGGYYFGMVLPAQRHDQELNRLDRWFYRANEHPPARIEPAVWNTVCINALHNSVRNCLGLHRGVTTAQVRRLADYLDATQGRDLQSLEGAYGLMEYIESMTPSAAGYFGPMQYQVELDTGLKPKPNPIRVP